MRNPKAMDDKEWAKWLISDEAPPKSLHWRIPKGPRHELWEAGDVVHAPGLSRWRAPAKMVGLVQQTADQQWLAMLRPMSYNPMSIPHITVHEARGWLIAVLALERA